MFHQPHGRGLGAGDGGMQTPGGMQAPVGCGTQWDVLPLSWPVPTADVSYQVFYLFYQVFTMFYQGFYQVLSEFSHPSVGSGLAGGIAAFPGPTVGSELGKAAAQVCWCPPGW